MSAAGGGDAFAPDLPAQRAILLFAITSGALLLVAHEALAEKAAWFSTGRLFCLWFTFATVVPLFAALTVQRLADRRFWRGLGLYAALLGYLAFYSGRAMEPESVEAGAVALPYIAVLIVSGQVLAAWFAVHLRGEGYGYPLLFEAAWRLVSTLAQVLAYTAAFWLLLVLWALLFKALGIDFFADLFGRARFVYPVSSLVVGYALGIARTRSSLGDTVHLRVLALWRGLLPLAAMLALAFAAALLLRGVGPLWATRHASPLLLCLVFTLAALSNAAYGKGTEPAPTRPLRLLVNAALVLLPLFVALAAWGLSLRWQQYGISLDRLWAALLIAVAAAYALGYSVAALRREGVWLAGIAPVNRAVSLAGAALLLLTQTGALDFRAITAHSLLARGAALKDEDLHYLRWELGHPGLYALQRLRDVAAPARAERIRILLASEQYGPPLPGDGPTRLRIAAGLEPLPEGLGPYAEAGDDGRRCAEPAECWLLRADLVPGGDPEWLRLWLSAPQRSSELWPLELDVLERCTTGWCTTRTSSHWRDAEQIGALRKALEEGRYAPAPPAALDLQIGDERLELGR